MTNIVDEILEFSTNEESQPFDCLKFYFKGLKVDDIIDCDVDSFYKTCKPEHSIIMNVFVNKIKVKLANY